MCFFAKYWEPCSGCSKYWPCYIFTNTLLNCAAPLRNADLARDDFLADPKRIAKKLREYICFNIKIREIQVGICLHVQMGSHGSWPSTLASHRAIFLDFWLWSFRCLASHSNESPNVTFAKIHFNADSSVHPGILTWERALSCDIPPWGDFPVAGDFRGIFLWSLDGQAYSNDSPSTTVLRRFQCWYQRLSLHCLEGFL